MSVVARIPPPPGITVRLVPWRTASDEDLALGHAAESGFEAELHHGEATEDLAHYVAGARSLPSHFDEWSFVAQTESGVPAGLAYGFAARGENPHALWTQIIVQPELRRRGLATHLLAQLVEVALADGRSTLIVNTCDAVPGGEAFMTRAGASPGRVQRESDLDLTTIDRELVRRWLDEGPRRAPGYELVLFEGPYPEGELEAVAHAHNAMNLAPLDDLLLEDRLATPDRLRESDKNGLAMGQWRWEYLARKAGDPLYGGFTNVFWRPADLSVVHQGGTAVWPEHRGHALGKWLKAAMLEKVFHEAPDARLVRTQNAYSNDAMLGINVALGFEVTRSFIDWTLPVEAATAYLDSRGR